jgi:threonine synthase
VTRDTSYAAVLARKNEILKTSVGLDYARFERSPIRFDYEGLLSAPGYSLAEVQRIQAETGVGRTPLVELRNVTDLVRSVSKAGKGARIFLKDERSNPSGSFKDRRASVSVYHAAKLGYRGVVCASSGNYAAAVASQAAKRNLRAIIMQEVFDSRKVGQPEILEKTRTCEAYGAEVWQLTVGPELFYVMLRVVEETGYFSASLYIPTGVLGVETLGYEVATEVKAHEGRFPDAVVVTTAGGGNVSGTARGLAKAGSRATEVIGASVDLRGLHMASDLDFNRKSFTTGHSGFSVPFMTVPDRTDVPRNAARQLRYLDRAVLVTQGEVFYATDLLAKLEGLDRGPAGNTSLAAALAIAKEMDRDEILVVQETEYTGAGKLPSSQLTFARENGIEVRRGDPRENVPGKVIVIPEGPEQIRVEDLDLTKIRRTYVEKAVGAVAGYRPTEEDVRFLAEDSKSTVEFVRSALPR